MKPGEIVITGAVVKCGNCSATLGELVEYGELQLVRIGGVNVRSINGFCTRCSHEFHWAMGDQILKKIIERHERGMA